MNILNFLSEKIALHKFAFICALALAGLFSYHHIVISAILEEKGLPYFPISILADEYLGIGIGVHQRTLGEGIFGDVALAEHKNTPYIQPIIPPMILSWLAYLFGSAQNAFVASDIIFPAITFVLFYFLGFEITNNKSAALVLAAVSIFMPRIVTRVPPLNNYDIAWILHSLFDAPKRLFFDRLADPQLTVPFLAGFLYLFYRSLNRQEKIINIVAGVAAGVLFYVYFYYWVYIFVGLGIIATLFLLQKNIESFKKVLIVIGIGFLISIYHWINFFSLIQLPEYHDIAERIGPEFGRHLFLYPLPVFAYFQHTILAIFIWLLVGKKHKILGVYLTGLLLAVFVVYNFQIITGHNPQPNHWIKPQQFIATLSAFALLYWLYADYAYIFSKKIILTVITVFVVPFLYKALVTTDSFVFWIGIIIGIGLPILAGIIYALQKRGVSKEKLFSFLCTTAVLLLFIKGALTQAKFIAKNAESSTIPVTELKSYEWLYMHTPKFSAVGTPSFLTTSRLLLYSHNKPFLPNSYYTFASNEEIWKRFFVINKLFNVPPANLTQYFSTSTKDFDKQGASYLFHLKYKNSAPGAIFYEYNTEPVIPSDEWNDRLKTYEEIFMQEIIANPYKLDYLYYGPREQVLAPNPENHNENLKLEYDFDDIKIYKIMN